MKRSGHEFCGVCVGVGSGVEGYLGGDEAGVLYICVVVIFSRNVSNCFSDNALCNVSSGRMGGTPPMPSRAILRCFQIKYRDCQIMTFKKKRATLIQFKNVIKPNIPSSPVVLAFWIMSLRFGAELDPLITAVLKRLLVLVCVGIFLPPVVVPKPHNFE